MGGVSSPPHAACEQDRWRISEALERWRADVLGRNKLKLECWEEGKGRRLKMRGSSMKIVQQLSR